MAGARNRATVRRFRATPDAISRLREHVAFSMKEDASGNVALREVEFEEALKAGVPTAAIALDLAESFATREPSAGRSVLEKLLTPFRR